MIKILKEDTDKRSMWDVAREVHKRYEDDIASILGSYSELENIEIKDAHVEAEHDKGDITVVISYRNDEFIIRISVWKYSGSGGPQIAYYQEVSDIIDDRDEILNHMKLGISKAVRMLNVRRKKDKYQELADLLKSVKSSRESMEYHWEIEEQDLEMYPDLEDASKETRRILGRNFIILTSEDEDGLYTGNIGYNEVYGLLTSSKFYNVSPKKMYNGGESKGDRFLFSTPMGDIIYHETYCCFNWIAMSTKTRDNLAKYAREISKSKGVEKT